MSRRRHFHDPGAQRPVPDVGPLSSYLLGSRVLLAETHGFVSLAGLALLVFDPL